MPYLLALTGLGVLLFAWGILVERNLFTVVKEPLRVLPKGAKPIRVLHISDLHIAPWQKRKLAWISKLIELKPDLVVNTGDNLGHADAIAPTLNALSPLLEVPGVFVNGSNDYHAPEIRNPLSYLSKPSTPAHKKLIDSKKLTDVFENKGWKNLNNQSATLTIEGTDIGFLGLDDPHDELADFNSLKSQEFNVREQAFLLGVAHAPYKKVINSFGELGVDLIFAGHTHGGQVRIPLVGALVTNCDLPAKYAKGLSEHIVESRKLTVNAAGKKVWLNVCGGLGTSIFAPIRLFGKPEVRLLTLLAKN